MVFHIRQIILHCVRSRIVNMEASQKGLGRKRKREEMPDAEAPKNAVMQETIEVAKSYSIGYYRGHWKEKNTITGAKKATSKEATGTKAGGLSHRHPVFTLSAKDKYMELKHFKVVVNYIFNDILWN